MKKKMLLIILIGITILGLISYHKDWYTYSDGHTEYYYYIFGFNIYKK